MTTRTRALGILLLLTLAALAGPTGSAWADDLGTCYYFCNGSGNPPTFFESTFGACCQSFQPCPGGGYAFPLYWKGYDSGDPQYCE